jgi:hypothetical protein
MPNSDAEPSAGVALISGSRALSIYWWDSCIHFRQFYPSFAC